MVEHHSHLLSFEISAVEIHEIPKMDKSGTLHYITMFLFPHGPHGLRMVKICWDSQRFPDRLRFWGQMEVPLGIIPGGGACVNLRRVLGAARAMEVSGPLGLRAMGT